MDNGTWTYAEDIRTMDRGTQTEMEYFRIMDRDTQLTELWIFQDHKQTHNKQNVEYFRSMDRHTIDWVLNIWGTWRLGTMHKHKDRLVWMFQNYGQRHGKVKFVLWSKSFMCKSFMFLLFVRTVAASIKCIQLHAVHLQSGLTTGWSHCALVNLLVSCH